MLVGKDGGRHEHSHLLAVGSGLEGGAYGNLGLAESHVAANQSVHGFLALHVGLYGLGHGELVGGVLVNERSLKLFLHI